MLINNIDRLFNTPGVTALAIEATREGMEVATRGGQEWEQPLADALALRRSSKQDRIRVVIGADGAYTIFVQRHGGQVAAVVVANGHPFAKSVYRTIYRLGRASGEQVEPEPPEDLEVGELPLGHPSGPLQQHEVETFLREQGRSSDNSDLQTTAGRQRRAIQEEVKAADAVLNIAPTSAPVPQEMDDNRSPVTVPTREQW